MSSKSTKIEKINARGLHYKELNEQIHAVINAGRKKIVLDNINGQRFIGCGVKGNIDILIKGVPGNDMAAFMDGPRIVVEGNGEDTIGNTMNTGTVIVRGNAGDVLGYGMRGGKLYIRGDVGYRVGIHMKSYKDQLPVIIAGGRAGDFLGEYMAGGLLIVLGMNGKDRGQGSIVGNYVGTGMHGGIIYLRGKVEECQLGKEVSIEKINKQDETNLNKYLKDYCRVTGFDFQEIMKKKFIKLLPTSSRPYGKIYAY